MDYSVPESARIVHVRKAEVSNVCLYARNNLVAIKPSYKGTNGSGLSVVIGDAHMHRLPVGWLEKKPTYHFRGSIREFHSPLDDGAKITMKYSAALYGEGEVLRKLFLGPPHDLSKAEIHSCIPLNAYLDDAKLFTVAEARTKNMNGVRVLVLEGTNHDRGFSSYCIYHASDRLAFKSLTKVTYEAPLAAYSKHRKEGVETVDAMEMID